MGMSVKKKKTGGSLTPPENSKYQTTLAFEVISWALQSGQVSLKSVRWHVSPLPGPLMDMLLRLLPWYVAETSNTILTFVVALSGRITRK